VPPPLLPAMLPPPRASLALMPAPTRGIASCRPAWGRGGAAETALACTSRAWRLWRPVCRLGQPCRGANTVGTRERAQLSGPGPGGRPAPACTPQQQPLTIALQYVCSKRLPEHASVPRSAHCVRLLAPLSERGSWPCCVCRKIVHLIRNWALRLVGRDEVCFSTRVPRDLRPCILVPLYIQADKGDKFVHTWRAHAR
jgi:hypothetical protein